MIVNVTLEQEDFDHMHDVIYDIFDVHPTTEEIQQMWNMLPEDIRGIAIQWGTSDTVFREKLHEWLQEQKTKKR